MAKVDAYAFWTSQFPGIDETAARKSDLRNTGLEDLTIGDIMQISLLSNPGSIVRDLAGREIQADGSWRMEIIKGRPVFFKCS